MRRYLLFLSCCPVLLFVAVAAHGNSAPWGTITGAGTYTLGSPISIGATVGDQEGDLVMYTMTITPGPPDQYFSGDWIASGSVTPPAGGEQVSIGTFNVSGYIHGEGEYAIELWAWDYYHSATEGMVASASVFVVAQSAPTCDAGPDLTVTTDDLGGLVLHGMVTNASYYAWWDWDGMTWTLLTDCDATVGQNGEANLVLSAGQLAVGVHQLQLCAKTQLMDWSGDPPCGAYAWDTMTLVVKYTGPPTIERYRVAHVSQFHHGSPEYENLYRNIQVGVRVWGATAAGVTVVDSVGAAHSNATPVDQGPEGYTCFCTSWDEEDIPAPAAGPYTVIAHGAAADDSDAAVVITQSHKQFVDPPLPHITYPTPGSVIMGTDMEMTWDQFTVFSGGETSTVDWRGVGVAGPAACLRQCGLPADQLSADFAGLEPGQEYLAHLAMFGEGIAELAQDGVTPGSYQEIAADLVVFYVYSPVPVVQNVRILPFHSVSSGSESWYECAQISARDLDGWDDIVSITTLNPNGDPRPGPDGCGWTSDDGLHTVYQGWAEWGGQIPPISAGAYTVTAEDWDGNTSAPATATFGEWPLMHSILYPAEGSVIEETVPVFTWEAVPDAYQFDIWLLEEGPDGYGHVWRQFGIPAGSTSIVYNEDGSATAPQLTPGKHYELRISAFHPDQDPSGQAFVGPVNERVVRFTIAPGITYAEIRRGRDTDADGLVHYHQEASVRVGGVAEPAGVTVTITEPGAPEGEAHTAWFTCQPDPQTLAFCWQSCCQDAASPAGTYQVAMTDSAGHSDTVLVEVTEIPDNTPVLQTPPNDSVAPNPPSFSWSGPADVCYCLGVGEPDVACQLWCGGRFVSGSTGTATYNDDGDARAPLTPGHRYQWNVRARVLDIPQSDPRASSIFDPRAWGRFWVEPKFIGFLEPINNDGSSIFKLNSTVPVKFQLLNADGSYKSDATATLMVAQVDNDVLGDYMEAVSTAQADSGNLFRYDATASQYIFNLGTRNLGIGTWRLRVTVNGVVREVLISLK